MLLVAWPWGAGFRLQGFETTVSLLEHSHINRGEVTPVSLSFFLLFLLVLLRIPYNIFSSLERV